MASFNASNSIYTENRSSMGASVARSDRDAEDFVRYLLEGSGAEGQVDYAALRTELEQSQSQVLLTQQDSRVGSGLFLNPEQSARLSLSQENLLDSKVNASILSHPGFQESPIQGSSIGGAQQQSFQQDTPTKKVYRAPYAVSDASMTSSLVNNFKTQSEDAKDAVVRFVNQQLMTQGFPPLHPTLYSRVSSRGDSTFALSSGQLMSLKMTIMGILEEYVRKNEVNQSLIRRVSEAEFSGSQTGRLSREAVQNVLNPDLQNKIKEQQRELDFLKSQNTKLSGQMKSLEAATGRHNQEKDGLKRIIETLRTEKEAMESKIIYGRNQSQKTLEGILKASGRSASARGSDSLVQDVISYYEARIAQLQSVPPSSNKASGVPVSLDKELKSRELHDADGSLSGALGQQINSLQAQLDATKSAYRESQSEVELLKLQLISSRRSDWLNDISRTSGSVTTRDLIRRDKKLFKMKMYKVDVLDPGQARELVKDVCARLNIPSLDEIESGLDKIEAVVRLIPQMEQFVRQVDHIVRVYKSRFIDDADREKESVIPHKLPYLLETLETWGKGYAELEDLKGFKARIHSLLEVSETSGSDTHCLTQLEQISGKKIPVDTISAEMDAAQQAVHHFRDLFEIRSSAAVIPKMNDLFVFWAEVTAGLGRLKEALSLDDAAQPGRILVHAADALESMDKKELRPPANRTLEDISSLTESTMARDSSSMTGGQQQAQVSPTARPDSSRVNHANDEDQGDEDGHVHLSGVSPELELAELYPSLLMSRRGSASTSRRPSQGDVLSYP